MEIALKVLLIIASLGLIAVVLLQKGKSAGLSGAISGGAEHLFGKQKARGLELFLSRLTMGLAAAFFILAVVVAFFVKDTQTTTPIDVTPPAGTTAPATGTTPATPPAAGTTTTPAPAAGTTTPAPAAGTTTPPAATPAPVTGTTTPPTATPAPAAGTTTPPAAATPAPAAK